MTHNVIDTLIRLSYDFAERFSSARVTGPTREILLTYSTMRRTLEGELERRKNHPSPDDVAGFVLARGSEPAYEDTQSARALGLFSAVLADHVTQRHREKKEATRIVIEGKGERFDYLFFLAHDLDEVIVKNLQADRIFDHAGSYGKADILAASDIQGNLTAVGVGERGRVGLLLLNNIEGNNTGLHTAILPGSKVRSMVYRNVTNLDHNHHTADCIFLQNTYPVRDRPEGAAFMTAILEGFDGDYVEYWKIHNEKERGFDQMLERHKPLELLSHVEKRNYDMLAKTFKRTPCGRKHYMGLLWQRVMKKLRLPEQKNLPPSNAYSS